MMQQNWLVTLLLSTCHTFVIPTIISNNNTNNILTNNSTVETVQKLRIDNSSVTSFFTDFG